MMNAPVELLLSKLPDARLTNSGWTARCPAHDDQDPSLSISEGSDGQALVYCHAGCTVDEICNAAGLRVADLRSDDPSTLSTSTQPRQRGEKQKYRRQDDGKPKGRSYATDDDALAALDEGMATDGGRRVSQWTYLDAEGNAVAVVARYDLPTPEGEKQKKTFRPVARQGDEWFISGLPDPRPLYRLPELEGADQVFIPEGEKAADAAKGIGLIATTSAHGAQSPERTDWAPLAGKECVILPDNDEAGAKYADVVVSILGDLTPAPKIRVLELPGLPVHGDMADFVAAQKNTDSREIRRRVEALADQADVIQLDQTVASVERFRPFPTGALPEPIRGFVQDWAVAIGCDPSYLALPMLTVLGAAIGNTRRIGLKLGWTAPPILWTAIVGESGTAKTPAFKQVMRPLRERERMALERHAEAMRQFEVDLARYDKSLTEWKRNKTTLDDPPAKPDAPEAERSTVSDTTVEALAPLLRANPRGLLMARDELAGWIGSFDRYTGGKVGADAAHWLSMHNGETVVKDRASGTQPTVVVPRASVSITGGIQPAILDRALGSEHRESGLAARLLLACPPRKPKQWTEADIDPMLEAEYARLVDRLYELQPNIGEDGQIQPVVIGLTREAKEVWKEYYNAHANEQIELAGELAAAWSKLEEYAARLALVIHYVRWAFGDPELRSPDKVDAESMAAGVELAQWFKGEARRVYSLLSESDADRDQRRLIELIERKGGLVTARDVMRSSRSWATARDAELALDDLVKTGYGRWMEQPTSNEGGRPTRVFEIVDTADADTTPKNVGKNPGSVNVNGIETPDDEWGEI